MKHNSAPEAYFDKHGTVERFELRKKSPASSDIPPTAEDAIALLFAERHALELRHVAAWGWWLSFDGVRWTHDDTLHAFDRARAICREVAFKCERSAATVASAKTVAAVERLAKADRRLAATVLQWDAERLNFNTGDMTMTRDAATFDRQSGIGRAPDPLDYITKKTACRCAPAGTPHPI